MKRYGVTIEVMLLLEADSEEDAKRKAQIEYNESWQILSSVGMEIVDVEELPEEKS